MINRLNTFTILPIMAGAIAMDVSAMPYEIWVLDQSDTRPDGGGTLYVYQGHDLEGVHGHGNDVEPDVIDLGGAARDLCLVTTGTAPRRPHMMMFNMTHTHAIISFVATGHVLFLDGSSRMPVACLDAGVQAHAAMPAPDDSYLVVANQNGKLLQRITSNYLTNTFTFDRAAQIDLANCITPSGAPCQDATLRPDNAPICPIVDSASQLTFITLRGGGMFVVDSTTTPMQIVAEYDRNTIHPNGCGGVEIGGKMYINAGGGTMANPTESDLYRFALSSFSSTPSAPNTPAPTVVFSHDDQGFVDSHGAAMTKAGRYLWLADRAANRIVIVETQNDAVVNEISLVGRHSTDPAPDLIEISPHRNRAFVTLRGPTPLTGNAPGVNNAVGATPGLGVIRINQNGRTGVFQAVVPITHVVNGVETADPHGIAMRMVMSDLNGSDGIDLADFALMQQSFTGPVE